MRIGSPFCSLHNTNGTNKKEKKYQIEFEYCIIIIGLLHLKFGTIIEKQ